MFVCVLPLPWERCLTPFPPEGHHLTYRAHTAVLKHFWLQGFGWRRMDLYYHFLNTCVKYSFHIFPQLFHLIILIIPQDRLSLFSLCRWGSWVTESHVQDYHREVIEPGFEARQLDSSAPFLINDLPASFTWQMDGVLLEKMGLDIDIWESSI